MSLNALGVQNSSISAFNILKSRACNPSGVVDSKDSHPGEDISSHSCSKRPNLQPSSELVWDQFSSIQIPANTGQSPDGLTPSSPWTGGIASPPELWWWGGGDSGRDKEHFNSSEVRLIKSEFKNKLKDNSERVAGTCAGGCLGSGMELVQGWELGANFPLTRLGSSVCLQVGAVGLSAGWAPREISGTRSEGAEGRVMVREPGLNQWAECCVAGIENPAAPFRTFPLSLRF